MKKVDAIIIGAGRSGTTSLSKMLEKHPQICFSKIKEIHYFSIEELFDRGEKYFHSFFKCNNRTKVTITADTYLMPAYNAIERIKEYNPNMKIIVMLRNPVDRAYSSYNYSVNYGYHKKYNSFIDSIEKEKDIEKETNIIQLNNLGHFYCSLYHKHLKEWLKVFDKSNFLFISLDMLKNDKLLFISKIASFLDIDKQNFHSENIQGKHNANAVPKSKMLEQFLLNRDNPIRKIIRNIFSEKLKRLIIHSGFVDKLHNINRKNNDYEPISDNIRHQAEIFFKDDLMALKNITEIKV